MKRILKSSAIKICRRKALPNLCTWV